MRENCPLGDRPPFAAEEVEQMSQATSASTGRRYGLARVCRIWGVARSTVYWQRQERTGMGTRPGPQGPCTDDALERV